MLVVALLAWAGGDARAQAVEVLAGHQAATADVLFFEYFPTTTGQPTPWLLFHRSRAVVDHDIDTASGRNLPQFGMTNAVSFNPAAWRGIGPVAAVSIATTGVATKVGTQYARVGPRTTVFGWVVVEAAARPAVDLFVLARHVRPLSGAIGLFTQVESINVLATKAGVASSLTLRGRIGLSRARWQAGVGADLRRTATAGTATTANVGVFVRHAF